MSRIHEALQKAQQKSSGEQQVQEQLPEAAATMAVETDAFPRELAERRAMKHEASNGAPPPARPAPAETPVPVAMPVNQALAFERIDARYAGKIVVDENISSESR